jgi:hypothetical protein
MPSTQFECLAYPGSSSAPSPTDAHSASRTFRASFAPPKHSSSHLDIGEIVIMIHERHNLPALTGWKSFDPHHPHNSMGLDGRRTAAAV